MTNEIQNKRELIDDETSWLAKQNGFNWPTKYAFNAVGERIIADADDRDGDSWWFNNKLEGHACSPTKGMLAFWLKDTHNKNVKVSDNKYVDESFIELLNEVKERENSLRDMFLSDLRKKNPETTEEDFVWCLGVLKFRASKEKESRELFEKISVENRESFAKISIDESKIIETEPIILNDSLGRVNFKCINCSETNIKNRSSVDKSLCDLCWNCIMTSSF